MGDWMNIQLMMARARMNHQPIVGGSAWWRVKITACETSTNGTSAAFLSMRTTPGGATAATGGTPFASSQYDPSYGAANAFVNNTNIWSSATESAPWYLGYHFTSAVDIVEIAMTTRPDGGTYGQGWTAFTIQSSSDSTTGLDGTWADIWSVSGVGTWTASQTRVFTKP